MRLPILQHCVSVALRRGGDHWPDTCEAPKIRKLIDFYGNFRVDRWKNTCLRASRGLLRTPATRFPSSLKRLLFRRDSGAAIQNIRAKGG